jgi:predicted RNase H-like nuclease
MTPPLSVLGIDAAWTVRNPSGVALVEKSAGAWRLASACPSYGAFVDDESAGGLPDPANLVAASERRTGHPPSLVAIDMPLARSPIVARRLADNAVSRAYGAKRCATHTPNAARPGKVSDRFTENFAACGYPLATSTMTTPAVIEVYPHPALVELAGAEERLPYKAAKVARYWPTATPADRRVALLAEWAKIIRLLDCKIGGVQAALTLPDPSSPARTLKAFEDMLDAVVCAWVGVCALEGAAIPFGDEEAAIWIPKSPTFDGDRDDG